ncbi:SRPBCC family protein [Streptomyces sp. JNUCC 64]
MDWCHYRFHSRWELSAPPAAVLAVLERAGEYPRWWPQVRAVEPDPEGGGGTARFRSFLPFTLAVTVTRVRRDPAAGVLEAVLTGDLDGWIRWTLMPRDGGTVVLFDQEVEARAALTRVLAVPGRPLFRLNHAWMMRGGRRGIAALLAGG